MDASDGPSCNFDGGFNTLICEEDSNEHPSYRQSNRYSRQVPMFSMTSGKSCRMAAAMLAVLAAVLLIVIISLGAYYNKLMDTHLTPEDTERISQELVTLQDSYKTTVENIKGVNKQLDSEMSSQQQTSWELEHQKKRTSAYKVKIDKMTADIATLRSHLPMIRDGCRLCPPGWILLNSVCYFFPFSDTSGSYRSWQNSRNFCQIYGGDLAIIDTKDKENATVNHLINNQDFSKDLNGFWIGLRDIHEEGTWRWLDGTELVEGYWNDGEPNNINNEDCAAVFPRENFFKAWNDVGCKEMMKWICEKATMS